MKNAFIIILIVAAALIFTGVAVSLTAFCLMAKGDISQLNTEKFVEKTCEVSEKFDSADIYDASSDIVIKKSDDEKCTVVYSVSEKLRVEVGVKDNTLKVTGYDDRRWYERIGIFFSIRSSKITLYLPEGEYKDLSLKTLSGNINVPEDFTFENASVKSTSGDVVFLAGAKDKLTATSVSGDVTISGADAQNINARTTSGSVKITSCKSDDISVSSTSGDVKLENIETSSLSSSNTSGDIDLTDVTLKKGDFSAVSGDVTFSDCAADSLKIKTVSGDVEGTLKNDMRFFTSTVSGSVRVPDSDSENICEVKTTSGDIRIRTEK